MKKRVLNPERLRKVPPQFSWIDHRLVQENHFARCDHSAWTLYLFLASVADAQGLSYYSEASLMRRLNMDLVVLSASRHINDPSSATAAAARVERTVRSRTPATFERTAQRPLEAMMSCQRGLAGPRCL